MGGWEIYRNGNKEVSQYFPTTHNPVLFLLAQDDGSDTEFQNVGLYTSDAGKFPKEYLLHSEHGESLKTTKCICVTESQPEGN